jgi:hypothetical protein
MKEEIIKTSIILIRKLHHHFTNHIEVSHSRNNFYSSGEFQNSQKPVKKISDKSGNMNPINHSINNFVNDKPSHKRSKESSSTVYKLMDSRNLGMYNKLERLRSHINNFQGNQSQNKRRQNIISTIE